MPRPPNIKKVPKGLANQVLRPAAAPGSRLESRELPLDGLEALRLADLEGLYHQEAARRMGVSRATFGRVLASARRTLVDALVNGKSVEIGGGAVEQRPHSDWPCPVHSGRRKGRTCACAQDVEGSERFLASLRGRRE